MTDMVTLSRSLRFCYYTIITLTASALLLGAVPLAVSAQSIDSDYGLSNVANTANIPHKKIDSTKTAQETLRNAIAVVINIALGVVGSITLLLIIYSGFLWMTAAGSEEKIAKAKKIMGSAVVGLFIVLASYAISSFILQSIKSGTGVAGTDCGQYPPPDPNCETGFVCRAGQWKCEAGGGGGGGLCVNENSACGDSDEPEHRSCCNTTNSCLDDGTGYFSCQIACSETCSATGLEPCFERVNEFCPNTGFCIKQIHNTPLCP